jgi:hypothetical protein
VTCGVQLCVIPRDHSQDILPHDESNLTSCWNLWHNEEYVIPTDIVVLSDDDDEYEGEEST